MKRALAQGFRRSRAPRGLARGVTLIELMVVVAIIGVIAAIAAPNLQPLISVQRAAVSAESVANLLDRARRKAMVTGFCHRVRKVGNNLVVEERTTANCVTMDTTNWNTTRAVETAYPEKGVTFTIEGSTGTLPNTSTIVFRPNGRLYGDGDLLVNDDGARVLVRHASADRTLDVRVASNGRICGVTYTGTRPLPTPVVCGVGYGASAAGNPSCGAAGGGAELPSFAAFVGVLLLLRRRRPHPRREEGSEMNERSSLHKRKRARRGYLIIEVMVSGSILAVLLGAAVTAVATHRVQTARAARRAEAAGYAQQALAWEMAKMPPTCVGFPTAPAPFTVACTVADITPLSTPPLDEKMFEITITVTYPDVSSGAPQTSVHAARVRSRNRILPP